MPAMNARLLLKRAVQGAFLAATFPAALTSGFGRLRPMFTLWAQGYANVPGFLGNFARAAYYRLTLQQCSIDVTIAYGSFFAHPEATVAEYVSVGSYCVIGRADIGARTQIASQVQVTSGRHQHGRNTGGSLGDAQLSHVTIGHDCWIGAGAIIMADVGAGSTIGAGSVVVKEIPANVTAFGNPAVVRT